MRLQRLYTALQKIIKKECEGRNERPKHTLSDNMPAELLSALPACSCLLMSNKDLIKTIQSKQTTKSGSSCRCDPGLRLIEAHVQKPG